MDAVLDTPVVDFYNEILLTYPNAKVILTGVPAKPAAAWAPMGRGRHGAACFSCFVCPLSAVRDVKGWMRSRHKFYSYYSHGCHKWLAPWRRGAQYVYGTECPSREQACPATHWPNALRAEGEREVGSFACRLQSSRHDWPGRVQALKRYLQHNRNVYDAVPAGRLLVMDIAGGDGWEKLCRFIGRPVPTNITFPSRH